jgi:bis(5'-nucleosyl)-tetraphosphatase (symmetrical)
MDRIATYAIGDIQGCHASLLRLIDHIGPDAGDRFWLVGDLVNRGPRSLEVLRWARDLGPRAQVVLGNHDLHLLAFAAGGREMRKDDTVRDVLEAPDRDALLDWLRRQPLIHIDGGRVLVHAGLHPAWTVAQAQALAAEVEAVLRDDYWREGLAELYDKKPKTWTPLLSGKKRLRAILSVLVSIRGCTPEGELSPSTDAPEELPAGYRAWFDIPGRRSADHTICFGHWSTLGLQVTPQIIALDTGCVWGGQLTAYRLDDGQVFQVDSVER